MNRGRFTLLKTPKWSLDLKNRPEEGHSGLKYIRNPNKLISTFERSQIFTALGPFVMDAIPEAVHRVEERSLARLN